MSVCPIREDRAAIDDGISQARFEMAHCGADTGERLEGLAPDSVEHRHHAGPRSSRFPRGAHGRSDHTSWIPREIHAPTPIDDDVSKRSEHDGKTRQSIRRTAAEQIDTELASNNPPAARRKAVALIDSGPVRPNALTTAAKGPARCWPCASKTTSKPPPGRSSAVMTLGMGDELDARIGPQCLAQVLRDRPRVDRDLARLVGGLDD